MKRTSIRPESLPTFGINILRSQTEIDNLPPTTTAAEEIIAAESRGDFDDALVLQNAIDQVSQLVVISKPGDPLQEAEDLFTAPQLLELRSRLLEYYGKDVTAHIDAISAPPGYPSYVGRLALHFYGVDDSVTRQFSTFESRHTDPSANAIGPLEINSRTYAELATENMLRQFRDYYQTRLDFKLVGPTKVVDNSRVWERGIAEGQFIVLDYVRDLLSTGNTTPVKSQRLMSESMTVGDIEENIAELLTHRSDLRRDIFEINPILADEIDAHISDLRGFTVETLHRGRPDVPLFKKEPHKARVLIGRIETLLRHAEAMSQTRDDQEEIPVLDL